MAATSSHHHFTIDKFELTPVMKLALGVSIFLHIGVVILGVVGLPYIQKPPRLPQTPIAVEIVNIDKETTTNKAPSKSRLKPVPDKPKEEPKAEKKIKAPPKVETKAPPKVAPIDKPPEKVKKVKPKPKVPPPPSEKLEKPKPPEPKKEEKVEEEVVQEDQFLSVLKNLQDSEEVTEDTQGEGAKPDEMSPLAKFSQRLSASEIDAIRNALNAQFSGCWNLMAGAKFAEDITVSIKLIVNPDRTVQSARIADQWRYNQDSFYRAAADTALRAIRHPNCQVLDLPPDKYELWRDLTFNFNPATQL
ncbi:MAG: hypothetical protein MRY79_06945 [Alphaproteobacteria bacterium]|nr:hypothetical protein [Alphaproteobacteria bacterium]